MSLSPLENSGFLSCIFLKLHAIVFDSKNNHTSTLSMNMNEVYYKKIVFDWELKINGEIAEWCGRFRISTL